MKKILLLIVLIAPMFCLAQIATVINHQPSSNVSGNWRKYSLGQSFTVPVSYGYCCMNQLVVHMANISANDGFSAELRIYSGNGMSGGVIYGPENITVNRGANTYNLSSNVSISPGDQYTYEIYFPGGAIGGIYAYVMNEHAAAIDTEPGGHSWNNRSANTGTTTSNYDDLYEIYYVIPLPVTLTSFEANCNNGNVQLNWGTQSEINNDFFTIERSLDGVNFESVGTTEGNGNSSTPINYSWTDDNPLNGTVYYRLKQTDFDGQFEYHGVRSITCSKGSDFSIYPNPFKNSFKLQLSDNSISQSLNVEVIDCLGRQVHTQKIESSSVEIVLDEQLPIGTYFVKVFNETMQSIERINKMK